MGLVRKAMDRIGIITVLFILSTLMGLLTCFGVGIPWWVVTMPMYLGIPIVLVVFFYMVSKTIGDA